MTLLIAYAVFAIGMSFLCSLLEASFLSLPNSHIEMMRHRGSRIGAMLARMKDNIDRPLAGILTLNTIANTAGATGVGIQAGIVFGSESLGIVSAIMTFLILIFSEIIPKTIGASHARGLAPFTAVAIRIIVVITSPILVVVTGINRILKPPRGSTGVSRSELRANLRLGRRKGALGDREFRVLDNFFALRHIRVKEVMTPRTVVFNLSSGITVGEADKMQNTFRFTRIPICKGDLDHPVGYVTRTDILQANRDGRTSLKLGKMAKKFHIIPELASVSDALNACLQEHEHILLAMDEYGGTAGVITLEDIMETLLGVEIIDETDEVVDMRKLARERHERYLSQSGLDTDWHGLTLTGSGELDGGASVSGRQQARESTDSDSS